MPMPAKALNWLAILALLLALAAVSASASRQADAEPPQAAPAAADTEAPDPQVDQVDPAGYKHHTHKTYKPPSHKAEHPSHKDSPDYTKNPASKHHDKQHPHHEPKGPSYKKSSDYYDKQYDEDHDSYAPERPYSQDHNYPKPYYPKDKPYGHYPKPPPVCPFCPNNLTQCTNLVGTPQCLDLKSNFLNCGTCNKVCPQFSTCVNGNCTCVDGYTKCGDKCVDLTSDNNYCGDCFTTCNTTTVPAQYCKNSTCVAGPPPCPSNQTQCFPSENAQGTCVDLKTNSNACGACNRQCRLQNLGVRCENGDCCIAPGRSCLLPGVGLLCCGFNILSLIPGQSLVPTATCEARGILGGFCCYGVNKGCSSNNECCTGLECKTSALLGNSCQQVGCRDPLQPCNDDSDCCFGVRCVSILGRKTCASPF